MSWASGTRGLILKVSLVGVWFHSNRSRTCWGVNDFAQRS